MLFVALIRATIFSMGFLDAFKRGRGNVVIGSRTFSLTIAGHGVEVRPRLPMAAAHLIDGTLVFGPHDLGAARASGPLKNVLIRPGTPPAGPLAPQTTGRGSVVTYSTAQRGSTQLVLANGMADYAEVLEHVRVADRDAQWRLILDDHETVWPSTMVLRADGNLSGRAGYELALDGARDKTITLHGPYQREAVPPPDQLLSPGQAWADAGSLAGEVGTIQWSTVSFVLGDRGWAQRYYYVPLDRQARFVVRAQTPVDDRDAVFGAADFVARSLRPRR